MRRFRFAFTALVLAACNDGSHPATPQPTTYKPPSNSTVASASVSPNSARLVVGERLQLTGTARNLNGAVTGIRSVSWSSTVPAVASVEMGMVTAVSPGTASIIVVYDGYSAACAVTVVAAEGAAR